MTIISPPIADALTRAFAWVLMAFIILVPILVWTLVFLVAVLLIVALIYEVADHFSSHWDM